VLARSADVLAVASVVPRAPPPVCVRDDARELRLPLDQSVYLLGTPETRDVPACVDCLMDGFYKDMLTLAAGEFSEEEMEVLRPKLSLFNDAFMQLTRATLTWDANRRLATRLRSGGLQLGARSDALMLAVQERASGTIVGVVEVSQQPRDGKVPGDVRLPSLPWPEERAPWVAYLSNLAVRKEWRGRGLGSTLITACEQVADRWKFDEMYLHAATEQERLLRMYKGLAYEALPSYDQPAWVLAIAGREPTRYHRKTLRSALEVVAPSRS